MNADELRELLMTRLHAQRVDVEDESDQHRGHTGSLQGGHYRVTIVAAGFASKSAMERHRMVYAALETEMGRTIHALALKTLAPGDFLDSNKRL